MSLHTADVPPATDMPGASVEAIVRGVLREHGRLPVDASQVPLDADLYRVGLASHATINVMLGLEDAFDVEFPDRMLTRAVFGTISSMCAAVRELVAEG